MSRPLLLDLFCGAGGASEGYRRAGFDVVGVDLAPQPRYPFTFHQADALTFPLEGFDAIHASPPCHDHSRLQLGRAPRGTGWMLRATLDRLAGGVPWVVENVEGPTVTMDRWWVVLCGSAFGLRVRRHRRFGSSHTLLVPPCDHRAQGSPVGVYGHSGGTQAGARGVQRYPVAVWREAMGIPWMTGLELAQAVPPAYTEHLGRQLLEAVAL